MFFLWAKKFFTCVTVNTHSQTALIQNHKKTLRYTKIREFSKENKNIYKLILITPKKKIRKWNFKKIGKI